VLSLATTVHATAWTRPVRSRQHAGDRPAVPGRRRPATAGCRRPGTARVVEVTNVREVPSGRVRRVGATVPAGVLVGLLAVVPPGAGPLAGVTTRLAPGAPGPGAGKGEPARARALGPGGSAGVPGHLV